MKEPEPHPPSFIEGLGINSALWFEGKLDEWSQPEAIKYISDRRSKKWPILVGSISAAALLLAAYLNEKQRLASPYLPVPASSAGRLAQPIPDLARLAPRSVRATLGEVEMFLSNRETVATFRGGLLVNDVERLQVSIFPSVLERLSTDPTVGINLPPNLQSFAFIMALTRDERPGAKIFMENEASRRLLLDEYDRQQNLRAQGVTTGKTFNTVIPVLDVLRSVYQNQPRSIPVECSYYLVNIELSFAWVQAMKAGALGMADLPLVDDLTNEAKMTIGNSRPLPFRVYRIDPSLIEEALGLDFGTFKTAGSCG